LVNNNMTLVHHYIEIDLTVKHFAVFNRPIGRMPL